MRNREDGFTLPELLVSIAITGAIIAVIGMAAIQFTTVGRDGTTRLSYLDKAQNASTWFVRDAQNAFNAGTGACTANCVTITFGSCDMNVAEPFNYEADPGDPFGGTVTCSQTGTVTYYVIPGSNDLTRVYQTPSGVRTGTVTVARDVTVDFSVTNMADEKQLVTMHIGLPSDEPTIEKTYHAYLRATQ